MTGRTHRRVHLFVDTGVDDALAVVVAWLHPRLELTGVTAVAGNVPLERALSNTRYVLEVVGATSTVPLWAGASRRCDGAPFGFREVHGSDGLAGLCEPVSIVEPPDRDAPAIAEDTTLVCLAPMTTLLLMAPRRVVATYARPGEANHAMDPVAADTVRSAWSVTDVTPDAAFCAWRAPARQPGVAGLVHSLLSHQRRRGAGLGDAEALLRLAGSRDPVRDLATLLVR